MGLVTQSGGSSRRWRAALLVATLVLTSIVASAETAGAVNLPGAPGTPRATPTSHRVALSWAPPLSNGGAAVTDYVVQYRTYGLWVDYPEPVSPATWVTLTGLTNGVPYQFRVAAINAAGMGPFSGAVGATPRTVPTAPMYFSARPGANKIALTWKLPSSNGGAPITDYAVQFRVKGASRWRTFTDGVSTSRAVWVTGLANGRTYELRVAARNRAGTGPYTHYQRATPRTVPSAPRALTATPSDRQLRVTWTPPASDGGTGIDRQIVQYRKVGGAQWKSVAATASTATVTGLVNNDTYELRAAAHNAAGWGPWSPTVVAVARGAPSSPGRPEPRVESGVVHLGWGIPVSDGGEAITDFVVQYRAAGNGTWATFADGLSVTPSATVTDLLDDQVYEFRVAAANALGTGAWSPTGAAIPTAMTFGNAWAWGTNSSGQLGDGTTATHSVPVPVRSPSDWTTVSAGGNHSCAVDSDGTAWCWGHNVSGQLGDGTTTFRSTPVQVGTDTDWATISAGALHTCGTRTDGTAWCWGHNVSGQLGDGTTTFRSTPVQVGTDTDWATISAGAWHTCGTRTDGTAWCWGENHDGQLGHHNGYQQNAPVAVVGGATNWATISAGALHTCGTRTDGTAWCWGANDFGHLGDGTTIPRSPVAVSGGATNWATISAGAWHTCGTRSDGTAWCWGHNSDGQLGDGTTTDRLTPVQVGTDTDWATISAGGAHTCGIRVAGTAWCWGDNGNEALGDGTTTNRSTPVQVGTDTDWVTLDAGGSHQVARRA